MTDRQRKAREKRERRARRKPGAFSNYARENLIDLARQAVAAREALTKAKKEARVRRLADDAAEFTD